MLLFVATPITFVLGRETFQTMSYTDTLSIIRIKNCVLSILILKMDAPIYFATVRYLRERKLLVFIGSHGGLMKRETSLKYA
ncbi:hypothetical protein MtrunA17_Chr4g0031481 [Medicago truncatula]|uniref:Uncharacterized protein n=1 Tax=Medicago truncatula TaxID=3880 RepID=A0A396I883_MEDTR|nr:hypothetical protein MtrunA17_Chr4g0031481 [Medicago truncatula]